MKYLEQKQGAYWWTGNIRYFIYFMREIAGIILGACAFIIVLALFCIFISGEAGAGFFPILMKVFKYASYLAFGASIIHSVTWLDAMPRIMPFTLSKTGQKIAYLILIAVWISISWLAMATLFAPKSYV